MFEKATNALLIFSYPRTCRKNRIWMPCSSATLIYDDTAYAWHALPYVLLHIASLITRQTKK